MGVICAGDNKVIRWGGIRSLMRRKQVDSGRATPNDDGDRDDHHRRHHHHHHHHNQLAKELNIAQLLAIGVGSTIGAGVYVLVGTAAREHSGPSLTISFLIAGIAAALSAFCYAELASRCPSAGSAYHYSYICIGECVAWLIGWSLILEYTIGGSTVARGISPNLAKFLGGEGNLPFPLGRATIPGLDIVVDPCAALLVLIVTALMCIGIKESVFVQAVVTVANVCVMIFVIIAGGYLGFKTGWVGYSLPTGYFPFGVNGMLAGSATVFFAFIGFDSVASTAEEVKNPQRDLPWGIGLSLSICCFIYMMVSVVIVGLVPYFSMDPDTPISSAFAGHGMHWAVYIVTGGAVLALCSTLMGSILPQPRILMAMARDGLLPSFFSDVNKQTQVPVKSTITTGVSAAVLAFFMDVSELAGMVSVGTLLAFTTVAISILILRYIPPVEFPLPSSIHRSIHYKHREDGGETENSEDGISSADDVELSAYPLIIVKEDSLVLVGKLEEQNRRKIAAVSIVSVCVGVVILTSMASFPLFPAALQYSMCGFGGVIIMCGLGALSWIDQDDGRHSFGLSGGFICPFVPLLPICCILINTYLLINLGGSTWFKVSIWLVMGVFVYLFYGRTHSSLTNAIYVPNANADEIYRETRKPSVA